MRRLVMLCVVLSVSTVGGSIWPASAAAGHPKPTLAEFRAMTAQQQLRTLQTTVASRNPRSCPKITISGRAHRGYLVYYALRFRSTRQLGVSRVDRHGRYTVTGCRGAALKSYRRNGHELTYQVFQSPWSGGGRGLMKDVTTSDVRARSLVARGPWVAPQPFKQPLPQRNDPRGDTGTVITHPVVMHLEAIQAARTVSYEFSTETGTGFGEKMALDVSEFGFAGEAGQSSSISHGIEKRWVLDTGRRWGARYVSALQRVERYAVPEYSNKAALELHRPTGYYYGTSSSWTGHLALQKAPYHSCVEGQSPVKFYSNRGNPGFPVSQTVQVSDSVGGGVFGAVSYTDHFGATTSYTIHPVSVRRGGVHHYCVSGNTPRVDEAPDLYISEKVVKGNGCRILTPGGKVPCRRVARRH